MTMDRIIFSHSGTAITEVFEDVCALNLTLWEVLTP